MVDSIMLKADELTEQHGAKALTEAETLLHQATAARDHRAGIFYADVCEELREREPPTSKISLWRRLKRLLWLS